MMMDRVMFCYSIVWECYLHLRFCLLHYLAYIDLLARVWGMSILSCGWSYMSKTGRSFSHPFVNTSPTLLVLSMASSSFKVARSKRVTTPITWSSSGILIIILAISIYRSLIRFASHASQARELLRLLVWSHRAWILCSYCSFSFFSSLYFKCTLNVLLFINSDNYGWLLF